MSDRSTDIGRLILRRELAEVGRAIAWLEELGARAAWPQPFIFRLRLCLEEALSNVVRHAQPASAAKEIVLSLAAQGDAVTACIEDDGHAFDPTQYPAPERAASIEAFQIGGYGILLMRRFATAVRYRRIDNRNRLVLVFERV